MLNGLIATLQILVVLAVPAGVYLAVIAMRHRERARVISLMRMAIEAGRPLPPELIEALSERPGSARERDFRRGALLIGSGVALVVVGLSAYFIVEATGGSGSFAIGMSIAALGAIPGCLGAVLILLSRRDRA